MREARLSDAPPLGMLGGTGIKGLRGAKLGIIKVGS
jgi:hypothetical protein